MLLVIQPGEPHLETPQTELKLYGPNSDGTIQMYSAIIPSSINIENEQFQAPTFYHDKSQIYNVYLVNAMPSENHLAKYE
jgi:hypothetical protein